MSKVNIVLDATMLDMFCLCEARFNYRFNMQRETEIKAKPLDRGTVVHLGLEKYYAALAEGKHFNDASHEMLRYARLAGIQSDLEVTEAERIIHVLTEYVDFWRVDDQRFQIIDVERPFMYVLFEDDEVRISLIGKIDLVVSDNTYTNLPVDHKSYDREYPVRRLSNQFMNYCYAIGSNFLLVNKIGFQKTLKPIEKFKRIPVSYDSIMLEEWKQNVIQLMLRYLECEATQKWTMNFTSCDKFNRQCDYLEVCESSGVDSKAHKLNTNFILGEKWDVSKMLEPSQVIERVDDTHK